MERKPMSEIVQKLKDYHFDEQFDLVVAIGRGGIVPGYLVAQRLGIEWEIIWIKFRDEQHQVALPKPRLVKDIDVDLTNKRIILVDDVRRSGQTLELAFNSLRNASLIKTFVINGQADYYLYNEECFKFPWII